MATDFEGYSHEQLLGMIASLDAETVKARAAQLDKAATAIKEIGEVLKKHRVKGWEGEAAQAFQNWVSQAGSATLRLGEYSAEGSKWMTHAAQTMIEVKANTPKYDASAAADLEAAHRFHNDPDAQQMGRTAHSKLTGDHQQAVQQLTKLAQSYEASTTQLNRSEIPTFPPPPPVFAPTQSSGAVERSRPGAGGGASDGLGRDGSTYVPPAPGGEVSANHLSGTASHQTATGSAVLSPTAPPTVLPGRDANVDLDHLATLPETPQPPKMGMPGVVAVGPGGGLADPVVPLPPLTLPPVTGLKVPMGGSLPGVMPPKDMGGSRAFGLPARDTGIVGGRPVSPGTPSTGIPRGTVIGGEGTQAGGRGATVGGSGLPGTQAPSHGAPPTRRLATESGGIVGGRQSPAGNRSVPGGQPFTQGGSGLVRNAQGTGSMGYGGAGASTPGKRRGSQGGERPDYLAEDEETWQGDRRVVPPVID
ncbi:hypothetical protein [Streptomyces sp. NPDC029003]|uniref:WXG100 family type VII secretion target n=1 Tax=Streptomyces sp. NPDC029003 TaxID=3155125 RepID=UPI0033D6CC7A